MFIFIDYITYKTFRQCKSDFHIYFLFLIFVQPAVDPGNCGGCLLQTPVVERILTSITAKQYCSIYLYLSCPNPKMLCRICATEEKCFVLAESIFRLGQRMNADMIRQGIPAEDRIQKLRDVAYYQLNSLKSGKITAKLNKKIQDRLEQK